MKNYMMTQKEDDKAVERMAEAMSVIDDIEDVRDTKGMKEIIFYYMMLNMFKGSLLNGLYTHTLEYILAGAKSLLPNPDTRPHIDESVKVLQRYPLTATPPGICIIFSMCIDRPGSEKDVQAVKLAFEDDFNFDVFVKINPTQRDVKNLISKLSASRNMFYDR